MNKKTYNTGLGLPSVLTIIFVVLKLVGVINWSWWWVFSPTLISLGLTIPIIVGIAIFMAHIRKKCGFTSKKDR